VRFQRPARGGAVHVGAPEPLLLATEVDVGDAGSASGSSSGGRRLDKPWR